MAEVFHDRHHAGRLLAAKLRQYIGQPGTIVLGLPRGGVPVAYEIAIRLRVPLDVFVVRKLGVPGQNELALGAIASGGVQYLNEEILFSLGIPSGVLDRIIQSEQEELERRERLYRAGYGPPDIRERSVILVDDGLATGASMQSAVLSLRRLQPRQITVAVPVAARSVLERLAAEVSEVICLEAPERFYSVGRWYQDFSQTTDEEVRRLLQQARDALEERVAFP